MHQTTDLQITWCKIDRAERRIDKPKVIIEDFNISLQQLLELLDRNYRGYKIA